MQHLRLVTRSLGIALLLATSALAQDATSLPHFEVASVKPNTSGSTGSENNLGGPNVVFRNYVLGGILQTAFKVNPLQLEAPDWLFSERFDIAAKVADPNASLDEQRQMLQALLIERFGLTFHHETKIRPGFALVVARNGPKIQPVPDVGSHDNNNRAGRMERQRTTISDFAEALSFVLHQPVADETRMEGRYNVLLTYAPDLGSDGPGASKEGEANAGFSKDGPSIFTAIEEQLGLKLEPRKTPADVFVVDHVEKIPKEN